MTVISGRSFIHVSPCQSDLSDWSDLLVREIFWIVWVISRTRTRTTTSTITLVATYPPNIVSTITSSRFHVFAFSLLRVSESPRLRVAVLVHSYIGR
jgi:hypothetical protein